MRNYVSRLFQRCCSLQLFQERKISKCSQLVGRDIINPVDLTTSEIKTLIWTAVDLKHSFRTKSEIHNKLKGCNATVILNKPHIRAQVAVSNALKSVGCEVTMVVDEHWESSSDITDLGRCLSRITNIIIAQACNHESLITLSNGASVPVISLGSPCFKLVQVLADLMSVQEYYGYLRRLKLGYAGPQEALFNTYLITAPKLGIHMQYVCSSDQETARKSSCLMNMAMKLAIAEGAQISEYCDVCETMYRVHIVATTKHGCYNLQITDKIVAEADLNWTLVHDLPRSAVEITDDVFRSKNSLVQNSCENSFWILMALSIHVLSVYQPYILCPDFDGEHACSQDKSKNKNKTGYSSTQL